MSRLSGISKNKFHKKISLFYIIIILIVIYICSYFSIYIALIHKIIISYEFTALWVTKIVL